MKAIVANVLFGSIFGCLCCTNSTQASPVKAQSEKAGQIKQIKTARSSVRQNEKMPQVFNLLGDVFSVDALQSLNSDSNLARYPQRLNYSIFAGSSLKRRINYALDRPNSRPHDCILSFCDREAYPTDYRAAYSIDNREINPISTGIELAVERLPPLTHQPYVHKSAQAELQLGFQPTFWSSESKAKYWAVTTVEQWGSSYERADTSPLNYINFAPALASGGSLLTFSGGGDRNLVLPVALDLDRNNAPEFEDFRGGVAYHHGVFPQLTMGVGFFYEDKLSSFTQLTYDSDFLPLKTTVSLLSKTSDTEVRSHIRLQPASNLVLNFHSDATQQRFSANWAIYPGLNFIANANSKNHSYSTGFKVALQNNYFSLNASATLDHQQNLQWNLNSQIGRFELAHSSDRHKSSLELNNPVLDTMDLGFQCSAFVKYQVQHNPHRASEFFVWGGRIRSEAKIARHRHEWSIDLGYGDNSRDRGLIANGSIALQPDLFLQLGYQEVSAVSDETKIELKLSSD